MIKVMPPTNILLFLPAMENTAEVFVLFTADLLGSDFMHSVFSALKNGVMLCTKILANAKHKFHSIHKFLQI